MNVGNMIKTGVAVVGAAASLAVLYYYHKNKKATPKDNSSEPDSNKVLTKSNCLFLLRMQSFLSKT